MSEEQPPNGVLTANDVTALVGLMSGMLDRMETRIIARLDENSIRATERWKKHDDELEANTKRIVDRFEKIEADLIDVSRCIHGHLAKEHDEEVALQARVKPVRTIGLWLAMNWRSLLLALLALLGVMGWAGLEAHITTGP